MFRNRFRQATTTYYSSLDPTVRFLDTVTYESMLELSRRPSTTNHYKSELQSGIWARRTGGDETFTVSNLMLLKPEALYLLALPTLERFNLSLNRNKLFTTNKFGLVQFFAELDDSIALFTSKFYRDLSYGSVSWGVMPFVSEMKKLLSFLNRAPRGFGAGQRYEDVQTDVFSLSDVLGPYGSRLSLTAKVTYRLSGSCIYPEASEAQKWLDRLGLHPDINTAWDLLPLSFMVDWFLPVGDYIQSIHSSGWIRNVAFKGYETVKIECVVKHTGHDNGFTAVSGFEQKVTVFTRRLITSDLNLKNQERPTLSDIPSHHAKNGDIIKKLFDTSYLAFGGKLTPYNVRRLKRTALVTLNKVNSRLAPLPSKRIKLRKN